MSKSWLYFFVFLILSMFLFATMKACITGYSIFSSEVAGINLGYFAVIFVVISIFVILTSEHSKKDTSKNL